MNGWSLFSFVIAIPKAFGKRIPKAFGTRQEGYTAPSCRIALGTAVLLWLVQLIFIVRLCCMQFLLIAVRGAYSF